ncbi:hypothetical protein AM256_13410 [Burkholderia pseudomallei]|nr:hypothetical protein AM256_13410 [Burkholderia pseudomallei]ALC00579.1 hypothetical protein AM257_13435 [Burkholderia pseudomallei]OMS45767.1 hypothetical protein AQ741_01510 [Burkholderia pseudomallei]
MPLAPTPTYMIATSWPLKSVRNDAFSFKLGARALIGEPTALAQFDDHLRLCDGLGRALSVDAIGVGRANGIADGEGGLRLLGTSEILAHGAASLYGVKPVSRRQTG